MHASTYYSLNSTKEATNLGPNLARYLHVRLNSVGKAFFLAKIQKANFSVVRIHNFLRGEK